MPHAPNGAGGGRMLVQVPGSFGKAPARSARVFGQRYEQPELVLVGAGEVLLTEVPGIGEHSAQLARYIECSERVDTEGLAALLHEDVRFSMPPTPGVWAGRSTVVHGWIDGGFGSEAFGIMRCVITRANGQPAVAAYVRTPGDAEYEPLAIDVLRVQDGLVTEIVTFDRAVFEHFDLPAMLSAEDGTG